MVDKRSCLAMVCGLAALLLVGCQEDTIRRYRAPHVETPSEAPREQQRPALRLLGAILPHRERIWFFKLLGPADQVDEHKEAFERFVRSIRYTDKPDTPIIWTVPEGWKQEAGAQLRYATFRLPTKTRPLDLTVIPLGKEAGSILDNVNRWRDQMGLPPLGAAELRDVCKEEKIDGVSATLVEMSTPATGTGGGGTKGLPFTYTTPEGWKEQASPGAMSRLTFRVDSAELTITPLPGPAGGLLANVNRWRGQIGLGPTTDEQLGKELQKLDMAGKMVEYVELVGPDAPGRQRILGVAVAWGGQTWFFKMKGPADVVARQKSAFEAFVRSVRFSP